MKCPKCGEEFEKDNRFENHLILKHGYTFDYALQEIKKQAPPKELPQSFHWDKPTPHSPRRK